jgi:hypothetical protein
VNKILCELCFPKATEIAMIGSHISLFEYNGHYGLMGQQGHRDDEFFMFKTVPRIDPDPECEDENETAWGEEVDQLEDQLVMTATDGYCFIASCIEAGWNTERQKDSGYDGCRFACWLYNYCGKLIQDATVLKQDVQVT